MTPALDLADGHSTASAARTSKMIGERSMPLDHRTEVLMAISMSIGLVSTFATAITFFWFVKMKRKFRHDLIMLLVQADLVKSAAFVVCPLIQFATGAIDTTSRFCQFVGFVLALGIEASDIAVLLIAVHSAMYIRRPRSGLYPYRWWAYAAYVIIPILLAALAFADGGYVDLGAYCYLATDHGWTRLALSWIPRYVLFAFIVVTYLCIYIYVRTSIDRYDRKTSTNSPSNTGSGRPSAVLGRAERPRPVRSVSSFSGKSTDQPPQPPRRAPCPIHRKLSQYQYRGSSSSRGQPPADAQDPHLSSAPGLARPLSVFCPETRPSSCDDDPSRGSMPLHDEPGWEVARNRERIRRQLRSLFVYPLIYTLTWLFPLANQVQRQAHGSHAKPFWLSCLSLAGFAAQGFVNSAVFTARERPWRHTGDKGFWVALRGKLGLLLPTSGYAEHGAGRTLDEMAIEACTAKARREGEMLDETEAAAALGCGGPRSPPLEESSRNWWDASDLDADLERDEEEEEERAARLG